MKSKVIFNAYKKNILSVTKRYIREQLCRRRDLSESVRREMKARVRNNGRFKNAVGKEAYILCTGPSIRDLDLSFLEGKTVISVSHFYNHSSCELVKPRFHVLAANHPPFGEDHYSNYIDGLNRWDWEFTCFFGYSPYPHSIAAYLNRHGIPDFDFSFYETDLSHFRSRKSYLLDRAWDFTKSIPPSSTVLIQAIQLAVFAGCKRVYLIGCDHNYVDHFGKPEVPHFYDAASGHDDSEHLLGISTERWFNILAERWESYRYIKMYCDRHNVSILNATTNSKLDVFPMVDISELYV